MTLTLSQWHQRYKQQARWTQQLRTYIYQKYFVQDAAKILDVGCGTGVLEQEITGMRSLPVYGVDIDYKTLIFGHSYSPGSIYITGNGLSLPFARASFDISLCHFYMLWVSQAQNAINEMARVTKPSGYIFALAEPDYGGRIDFPEELSVIGRWQNEALERQGADPYVGRRLRSIFANAGLSDIEVGVLGAQWSKDSSDEEAELEWQVLASDLQLHQEFNQQVDKLKTLELTARHELKRILYVPVFYAVGKVAS